MRLAHCELRGRSGHRAARELLTALYREETGCPLPTIVRGPYGKPCFVDSPYYFSISHTDSHAFCILSKENVGIDAEELTRRVTPLLAKRILSASEMAQYQQAEDKNRAFLTFWVLKEAWVKLLGTGLTGFPNKTDFLLTDTRVQELHGCLVAIMTENEGDNHAF